MAAPTAICSDIPPHEYINYDIDYYYYYWAESNANLNEILKIYEAYKSATPFSTSIFRNVSIGIRLNQKLPTLLPKHNFVVAIHSS